MDGRILFRCFPRPLRCVSLFVATTAESSCFLCGGGVDVGAIALTKRRHVMAGWKVDDDRFVRTFGRVVLPQLRAKSPSLAANDSIGLRVIVGATAKHGNANSCFLQMHRLVFHSRGHDESEELH